MNNSVNGRKDIKRSEKIIYVVFTYMIFMFIIIVAYRGHNKIGTRNSVRLMDIEGQYSVDEGKIYRDYSLYKPRRCKMSTTLDFKGHFTQNIPAGEMVWIQVENMSVRVFVNGSIVYNNDAADDYLVWDYFVSNEITSTDELRVEMEAKNPVPFNFLFSKLLENISVGTKYALAKANIYNNLVFIIMSLYVLLIGVVLIPYCFQLRYLYDGEVDIEGFMSSSLMLIFGALNCLINQKYAGLIFDNAYLITYLAYIAKILTSLFIVRYIYIYFRRDFFRRAGQVFNYVNIARVVLYMSILMMTGDDVVSRVTFTYNAYLGGIILIAAMMFVLCDFMSEERENRPIIIVTLILVVCMIIEVLFFIMTGTYISQLLVTGLVVFTFTEWNSVSKKRIQRLKLAKRAQEMENELTQNQIKMMISQIQPHFLYNALGTIRALCVKDPQTARQAIDSFSKYLRANMDSLNQKGCIPFSRELEHTKCYLDIEQLRFGDLLKVEYDIQTMDFEIPALSLQTMAENAVKHGLLAKREGGTLRISTVERNSCYEIKVEDDGVGFDVSKPLSEERSHVGVANTRQRILSMCGGEVSIGSKLGVGTTITIVIPKEPNNK